MIGNGNGNWNGNGNGNSIDGNGIVKKCKSLVPNFYVVVTSVGSSSIVQFTTDNGANYKARWKLVYEYGIFYWTPCAAHFIYLVLEDMSKSYLLPINTSTIEKAKKIIKFIYNHVCIPNILIKNFTNDRNLIWAGITRFAMNFISLKWFNVFKGNLKKKY